MTELKLYKTKTNGLKIIGMSLPFVAIGIWMITDNPYGTTDYIMGWFGICFFGLGLPIGLFQMFDKRPQILITENGIWDRSTKQDEVKWEQIIEAYPLDIHEQKFISLVTDETFVFKKKPYKWVAKLNEVVGAQNLNLHLGQINIDQIELTNFINRLSNESIDERRKSIVAFKVEKANFSIFTFRKIFVYVLISVSILYLSLYSFDVFMTILIVSGISALIARWRPDNLSLKKYAGIITWLGFINLLLCFGAIKVYDNIAKDIGEHLVIEIEEFKIKNATLPTDIKSITKELELNYFGRFFADKIEYRANGSDYVLEAEMLFGNRRQYDHNKRVWK